MPLYSRIICNLLVLVLLMLFAAAVDVVAISRIKGFHPVLLLVECNQVWCITWYPVTRP